jgi:hypothetical protein
MDIYIGNLPSQVDSSELKKVVNAVMFPANFKELVHHLISRNDRITFSEFDVIENRMGEQSTRFAHAVIMPEHAARLALKRLDHLTLKGSSLRAREYAVRNIENDRRSKGVHNLYAVSSYNRRIRDRRLPVGS